MSVSVIVVMGILDAGKSTFINSYIKMQGDIKTDPLIIQFEQGDIAVSLKKKEKNLLWIPVKEAQQQTEEIRKKLYMRIVMEKRQLVIIEWNGLLSFSILEELLLNGIFAGICDIKATIYLADVPVLLKELKYLGQGPVSQIMNADYILYRETKGNEEKEFLRRIKLLNKEAKVLPVSESNQLKRELKKEKQSDAMGLCIFASVMMILALLLPVFGGGHSKINDVLVVFMGLMLQGIPFLLLGVILSSLIQVFVSSETIKRLFPKNKLGSMLVAVLAGFCLPVCDCASIPIFKSLVKKGVPLYAAVTFMMAAPVINPVVILSTYYAFHEDVRVVLLRMGLGVASAIIIGLFTAYSGKKKDLEKSGPLDALCSCGCMEEGSRISVFIRHSELEFLDVARYLVFGTFISAIFQETQIGESLCVCEFSFPLKLAMMMLLAFLLSLCSSADAIVAKSFMVEFPLSAVMGFLVFGPMMDIKNVLMLQSGFKKTFVIRLCVVTFLVCFLVVLAAAVFSIGGLGYE